MFRIFGVVVLILLIVLNKTYLSEAAPFPEEREDQQVGHFCKFFQILFFKKLVKNLDYGLLFIIFLFFSYSQMIQDMIVCGYHPLTQEVNQN